MSQLSFITQLLNFARLIEAVLIVMVTTVSVFIAATFLGTCVQENSSANAFQNESPEFVSSLRYLFM